MQISATLIRAAATLPEETIRANLQRALDAFMESPDSIISASTGAGASYTKKISATAAEMVEFWQTVLDYKLGEPLTGNTQTHSVIFTRPFA